VNEAAPDEELQRQYDRALDEYRFQVDLNWRRSEYFFVLNVGILIAAATVFSSKGVPRALVALLFLIGALLAVLSFLANDAQHTYYRAARALKQRLEERMDLDDLALTTTPGMGSSFSRLGRVRTFLKVMLVAIALVDIGGAALAIADAATTSEADSASPRTVLVYPGTPRHERWSAFVVTRDGKTIQSRPLKAHQGPILVNLPPGKYLVSLGGRSLCENTIEVDDRPLQPVVMAC
jgi:hypothetical protein